MIYLTNDFIQRWFKLFDALRLAKEKRRRRSRPAEGEFSDLDSENFEIFYPDIIY